MGSSSPWRSNDDARQTGGRATTVELVIDGERCVVDSATAGRNRRWVEVVSVEVVCTPVRTADGAKAFVLIAEGAESGAWFRWASATTTRWSSS